MESRLKKVRLIWLALTASIPIFGWVAEFRRGPGSGNCTPWHWLVTGLALWVASAGFRLRYRLLRKSEDSLKQDPSNTKALKQWEARNVMALAMAQGVATWGLIVRMVLNGALWQASIFYGVGLVLLLLWTPRMAVAARSN